MEHQQLQPLNDSPSYDASLINRLPPELFLKIFGHVHHLLWNTSAQIPDGTWTIPYQLVCRRWRDFICSTPQFWQEMKVWKSPEWLEFSLTRCAGALATIFVFQPTRPDETFAIIRRFASSIKEFHLRADVRSAALLSSLPSVLATPMPALEHLYLDGPLDDGELIDVRINRHLVPCLTALSLMNLCMAPLDTAVYTSLRSLTLFKSPWAISYRDFLGVMRDCQDLEYLSLHNGVLDAFTGQVGSVAIGHLPSTDDVVLPRLKSLKLSGHPNVLFHLLAMIHAPQVAEIRLRTALNESASGPHIITRLLAPKVEHRYPFLASPRTLSLTRWGTLHLQLSLRCGPQGHARLIIDHHTRDFDPEGAGANLQDDLITAMQTFSVAAVDTLEVSGAVDQISLETWQRAFHAFPSLRTLAFQGYGTLDGVWAGLARATAASLERRDDGDGGPGAPALCCPLLSEVVTETHPDSRLKFSGTPTLFEGVRAALNARAEAGYTRLEKLKLYLQYPEPGDLPVVPSYRLDGALLEDVRSILLTHSAITCASPCEWIGSGCNHRSWSTTPPFCCVLRKLSTTRSTRDVPRCR